jgi:hypothetical protein
VVDVAAVGQALPDATDSCTIALEIVEYQPEIQQFSAAISVLNLGALFEVDTDTLSGPPRVRVDTDPNRPPGIPTLEWLFVNSTVHEPPTITEDHSAFLDVDSIETATRLARAFYHAATLCQPNTPSTPDPFANP